MSDVTPASMQANAYWESIRPLGFALPYCASCGTFHFYPLPACPACGATTITQRAVTGRGSLYSYSVVYRAPSERFRKDVPYVVAIVATAEGPHLMTRLVNIAPQDVQIGMPVRVRWGADMPEPLFEPEVQTDPEPIAIQDTISPQHGQGDAR